MKVRGTGYHDLHKIDVFDSQGKYLRTAFPCVTDGSMGPRMDNRGNMYLIEGVNQPAPKELAGIPGIRGYASSWGRIVKFGPEGGAFWPPRALKPGYYKNIFGFDKPTLKAPGKTVDYGRSRGQVVKGALIQGSKWEAGSPAYHDMHRSGSGWCHCIGYSFDTDDFGRTFYPDHLRYQGAVMDAAGNEILRYGAYGNRDNRGPYSWVRDPKTKKLRPRAEADPQDLLSPYAKPGIPFAWLNGMAVTDRHIYATDTLNQRVTRIELEYQAEATCTVQ